MRIVESAKAWLSENVVRRLSAQHALNESLLQERLSELELALEEYGWQRFGQQLEREFSRRGLWTILRTSRYMFLKNPLVNRAVSLQAIYVWAQGVTISSDDESTQVAIEEFTSDYKNQVEIFSHQARTMKEQDLQVNGNLFFVFFSSAVTGQTIIRTIPVDEVQEIHCNPEDAKEPQYYHRTSTLTGLNPDTGIPEETRIDAYYPDFRYEPDVRPETIGGKPVMWDSPVFHVRVGGLSDMRFGVPETYQAIDWTRAYTSHMENWSQVTAAYATFALKFTQKGGKAGAARVKAKYNTTLADDGISGESNPPPNRGSMAILNDGSTLEAIKTSGMTTSADEGRRLLLMVCASFGFPESFFGDVSVGTLATAKSLNRPTELKFRDRQELWKWILVTIIEYALARRQRSAAGIRTLETVQGKVKVSMPPILEHDVTEQLNAIVSGATLDGKAQADTIDRETLSRMILNALGEQDVDGILAKMADIWDEKDAETAARTDAMNTAIAGLPGKQQPAVQESLRKLVDAIDTLRGKVAA